MKQWVEAGLVAVAVLGAVAAPVAAQGLGNAAGPTYYGGGGPDCGALAAEKKELEAEKAELAKAAKDKAAADRQAWVSGRLKEISEAGCAETTPAA
jgi:hypothetical protein